MTCINVAFSGSAKLIIPKFKDVEIFVQNFALPGVRVLYPEVQGPRARTPMSATGIQYDPLAVKFLIGENFSGYKSIIEWLQDAPTMVHSEVFSDATITLLTNSKTPFQDVIFRDVTPVSCAAIEFDVTLSDPQPLVAQAIFDYTSYSFI